MKFEINTHEFSSSTETSCCWVEQTKSARRSERETKISWFNYVEHLTTHFAFLGLQVEIEKSLQQETIEASK